MTSRMFTPNHIPQCFARNITHSDHRIDINQKSDFSSLRMSKIPHPYSILTPY